MAATQPPAEEHPGRAKRALRAEILARRAARTPAEVAAYGERLATAALAHPVVAGARCVAAYVGVGTEPATLPLLDALRAGGVRVLLPVLRPDWSLDWGRYDGRDALVTSSRGLLEPRAPEGAAGTADAVDALGDADVVLLPGLACSADGARLGRGGGAYDRALAALRSPVPTYVLLHPDEVGIDVPTEPHDVPVDGAITG
ncbi:5-formyltetrahydrofolate cyclo-ligase [Nocardioides sp. ChNu-153]|uniref:5-formyltetrahydrofolate cyclo-ligase n=1 Tax=unclassified Nocardioides TaxID=2615069 RepID=UPI0024070C8C|nr:MULTISPECIES: 5-formyltetrahydrofolate cyclo-ligase [unclassified Nocardioides]MDF9715037.1 5-formyltetrahydrofolate cyclo-ligase [Nocardioides sp. ChNu-99]MDN7122306.1 5-formyltetrahydrofolate cyclo-ligase [Nocardioides sp. ChNu-153]